MTSKEHNQFMKTYKMAVSFKLNHIDFSTVSSPVSSVFSSLSSTTTSKSFPNKVSAISFKSLTKASNKPFPRATRLCSGNFTPEHLHNLSQSSYLILLVTLQLNSNIALCVNLSCRLNPSLLM